MPFIFLIATVMVFTPGGSYTRREVVAAIGADSANVGGMWNTGYRGFNGAWYLFCTVGDATTSGFDYPNEWVGDRLRWTGKTQARLRHPQIQDMTARGAKVHVFWRSGRLGPFTYAGLGRAVEVLDTEPVTVTWAFDGEPGPESDSFFFPEGKERLELSRRYERDSAARKACLAHHGAVCAVCDQDPGKPFGVLGLRLIHVHHLKPLSQASEGHLTDPAHDMVPVCPTCHAALHLRRPEPYSVKEMRAMRLAAHQKPIG